MKSLKEALAEQPSPLLQGIAELNGIALAEGASRDQLAATLADELARPETTQRAWESLGAPARNVLVQIVAGGGHIKAFRLLRDHGEIRAFGPAALARDKPWLSPANPTEELWYLGLIQHGYEMLGEVRGEVYFIPDEILAHLPQPESAGSAVQGAGAPEVVADHGDALMWDMFILMAWVAREEPPLDERGNISPADLYRLHAQLTMPDAIGDGGITDAPRLSFLLRIARGARLVKLVTETGLRLGPQAKAWLRETHQNRRLALWEAWRRERVWNELQHVPTLKVQETGWRNDPRLARAAVCTQLAHCAEGWWSLPSFVAEIKRLDPDFQRPDGNYDRWHIRDAQSDRLLLGFSQWEKVEGAQIAFMVENPLLWLGVVRTGGATREARVFQVTEFGARALGVSDRQQSQPRDAQFVVQGDFEVLVPRDAPLYGRFQLERMAERVTWDRISTYRLTRESLTRLLRRNTTIEQILSFLKRISRPPFPRNVEFTLREWAAKYGEISLRRAAILHTRDRTLLAELQQHPELGKYIVEVISPTVALVVEERLDELHKRLEALGYSPRLEAPDPKA